jgi:hypothetical protein
MFDAIMLGKGYCGRTFINFATGLRRKRGNEPQRRRERREKRVRRGDETADGRSDWGGD